MYWSGDVGGCSRCPECQSRLETERHTFYIVIRYGGMEESAMVGGEGGWFCPKCPVVVLDNKKFDKYALLGARDRTDTVAYLALGLDMEAVPEDKRNVPFGDDNPEPLVMFKNYGAE